MTHLYKQTEYWFYLALAGACLLMILTQNSNALFTVWYLLFFGQFASAVLHLFVKRKFLAQPYRNIVFVLGLAALWGACYLIFYNAGGKIDRAIYIVSGISIWQFIYLALTREEMKQLQ